MKVLLQIKFLLLITCILADTVMPLILPCKDAQAIEISEEAEKEKGGEEKVETDKIVDKHHGRPDLVASRRRQQFFEHDRLAHHLASLPIITPPPKAA